MITGKDKGKQGTILQRPPADGKVIVSGVNTASKHLKPGRRHPPGAAAADQGGIIEIDMPIDASNVMYVHKGKPVRLGYQVDTKGNKVRIAKLGGGSPR